MSELFTKYSLKMHEVYFPLNMKTWYIFHVHLLGRNNVFTLITSFYKFLNKKNIFLNYDFLNVFNFQHTCNNNNCLY